MRNTFSKETERIYRLCVPFEKIYTSVFLIVTDDRLILVDTATTDSDVDECIIPALNKMGYTLSDIDTLVITHKHCDHFGGLGRILHHNPKIKTVDQVTELSDGIYTYPLAGHTLECIGVLDVSSNTLISADGLQGAGVDKYRCYTKSKEAYIETLNRIKNDTRIQNVLFSHDYEPWNVNRIFGRDNVLDCIEECKKYI